MRTRTRHRCCLSSGDDWTFGGLTGDWSWRGPARSTRSYPTGNNNRRGGGGRSSRAVREPRTRPRYTCYLASRESGAESRWDESGMCAVMMHDGSNRSAMKKKEGEMEVDF